MIKLLSIIIVTYNSERLIFDCLDSIFTHNDIGDSLEIIVVDNNSTDQTLISDKIKNKYSFDVIFIANKINGGYGFGNNAGVKQCSAKHFIVMNPDVRILYPIFKTLLSTFNTNPKIGMLGVTFSDKSSPLYFKPEFLTFFRLLLVKISMYLGTYKIHQMYMSGSFLMFNKRAFLEAGSFDENFFLFYEEPDISNRILSTGNQLVFEKNILVNHLTHNRTINPKLASIELDSLEYYLKKYQIPPIKVFKSYLWNYRIKFAIATILLNTAKKTTFRGWILLIKEKISRLN